MAKQPESEVVLTILPNKNFRPAHPMVALTKAGERDAKKQAKGVPMETAEKMFAYWRAIFEEKLDKAITSC